MQLSTLTVIVDIAGFVPAVSVDHDDEYLQVRITDPIGTTQTWVKRLRLQMHGANVAEQIREVAALVSVPALIHWMQDTGFTLNF
jgi:hypothetical protein